MNQLNHDAAIVCFSGGQDSTTCLFWALQNFEKVHTICFDYGQRHIQEIEVAKEIAKKNRRLVSSIRHESLKRAHK